jgi:CheY-like chemotaxis protein
MLKEQQIQPTASMNLQGVGVLCVDNEQAILEGMSTLLKTWQCQVFTAINAQQAKEIYQKHEDEIDICLVDYQLTEAKNEDLNLTIHKLRNDEHNKTNIDLQINGIELIKQLRATSQYSLPAILITATTDENLMTLAKQNSISYLQKIIKPLALRALMSSLLTKELAKNYANK